MSAEYDVPVTSHIILHYWYVHDMIRLVKEESGNKLLASARLAWNLAIDDILENCDYTTIARDRIGALIRY